MLYHLARCSGKYHLTTLGAAIRSHIDDIISQLHDIRVVLQLFHIVCNAHKFTKINNGSDTFIYNDCHEHTYDSKL